MPPLTTLLRQVSQEARDGHITIEEKGNLKLIKSVRNLANAKYIAPEGLNVYDVLRYKTLVMTKSAAKQIEERLSR